MRGRARYSKGCATLSEKKAVSLGHAEASRCGGTATLTEAGERRFWRVGRGWTLNSGPGADQNHDSKVILIVNKANILTGMRIDLSASI